MERKVNMRKLHTSVVEAAFQAGYPLYRIPGIVATETGALLVGYEARNTLASRGMGDWAVIDLYGKRSVRPGKAFAEHRGIPEGEHYRAVAVSRDGATNWTDAHFDTNLRDPVCASGLANCPGGILYSGCDSERSRTYLTLRFSPDDGASWTDSLMYETLGGYSDVCYNAKTGTAFVAYEYDDYRDLRVSEIALDASNSQEDNV